MWLTFLYFVIISLSATKIDQIINFLDILEPMHSYLSFLKFSGQKLDFWLKYVRKLKNVYLIRDTLFSTTLLLKLYWETRKKVKSKSKSKQSGILNKLFGQSFCSHTHIFFVLLDIVLQFFGENIICRMTVLFIGFYLGPFQSIWDRPSDLTRNLFVLNLFQKLSNQMIDSWIPDGLSEN